MHDGDRLALSWNIGRRTNGSPCWRFCWRTWAWTGRSAWEMLRSGGRRCGSSADRVDDDAVIARGQSPEAIQSVSLGATGSPRGLRPLAMTTVGALAMTYA